ncbi:CRTAC1 family protein [Aureliella helgolandensis]|nr:CRTAC1 family protein [Aureliella helgolandensis]
MRFTALLALGLALCGCKQQVKTPTKNWTEDGSGQAEAEHLFDFRDHTVESLVRAVYDNGEGAGEFSIVESLGGGVAALDYDRDGSIDLLFPGGGSIQRDEPLTGLPSTLWRQRDGLQFRDCTELAHLVPPKQYSHGCTTGDFDNDGFDDVLITGYDDLQLLHNLGDGTFAETALTATPENYSWSSSAAWGDFNGDGNLDLYIANYVDWSWENHPACPSGTPGVMDVCTPNDFSGLNDTLYFSNGDGTFRRADESSGLEAGGKGLGVLVADFNSDGHADIYVANDTTNNFLYLNDGTGSFLDAGLMSGTGLDGSGTPNGSMGIALLDFDQNLEPDLWVTNYENESYALYENNGDARFMWATERAGLNSLGNLFVGFGTIAADLDLDGDEDLVVTNGHVMIHPKQSRTEQQSLLLANSEVGDSRRLVRQEFSADSFFSKFHRGRGLICGDLDRDGDLDLVYSHTQEPAAILLNETQTTGKLLSVDLVGTKSNRNAIGTRAILHTNRGKFLRSVVGGGSYLSQNPYTLHWGILPDEVIERLEIYWPSGILQSVTNLHAGAPLSILESPQ